MKNTYIYWFSLIFIFTVSQVFGVEQNQNTPVQSKELTLEQAMDKAEAHSYPLKIATQTVNINQNKKNSQILSLFPNVSVQSQYLVPVEGVNSLVNPQVGPDISVTTIGTSFTAGATLIQPIVGLTSIILKLGEDSAKLKAAAYDKNQTALDQRYLGANAYINATKAIQLIEVAEKAIEVATKQLEDAQARYDAGLITNADVLQFRLNYDNSKKIRVSAETTYQVALVTLAEIMGEKDLRSIHLPKNYQSVMEGKKDTLGNLNVLVKERLPMRYDILSSQETISASGYATLNSMTSYLPSFNFILQFAHNFRAEPVGPFSKKQVENDLFWGFQLEWNVWDWGIRQTQINSASAAEQISRLQFYQTRDNAHIDITSTYNSLIEAYETLNLSETSLKYAEAAYKERFEQFRSGIISSTDLVISANDQTSAQANYVSAVGELDLAWMAFYRSTRQPLTTLN